MTERTRGWLIIAVMFVLAVVTLLLSGLENADAATSSAVRSAEYNQTILGIVGQLVVGGVEDVTTSGSSGSIRGKAKAAVSVMGTASLTIDGEPAKGLAAWLHAVNRIAGYALDRQTAGSIDLAYGMTIRGYPIRTATKVTNDHVTKTFTTGWTEVVRIPVPKPLQRWLGKEVIRRIPINVAFQITAAETAGSTVCRGVATGTARTDAFRFGCIRRIAEQRAADELDAGLAEALRTIQTKGEGLYAAGASDVLRAIHVAFEFGKGWRR